MHQNQSRRDEVVIFVGCFQATVEFLAKRASRRLVKGFIVKSNGIDLRSNQCPVHEKERQHSHAFVVTNAFEIPVQKPPAEPRQTSFFKVHHHERDFAHDIDPAEIIVELDAVEQAHLSINDCDVSEMQVAVDVSDHAVFTTKLQHIFQAGEFEVGPVFKLLEQ